MNPRLQREYGFKRTAVKLPGRKGLTAWKCNIGGRQCVVDVVLAGNDATVVREIAMVRGLDGKEAA